MSEDIYPYWFFYIKPKYSEFILSKASHKYRLLYGYTDDESIAKQFKLERNMDRFTVEHEYLDRDDIHRLTDECQRRYLKLITGRTKVGYHGSKIKKFSVIMTIDEKEYVDRQSGSIIHQKLWENTTINPKLFLKEYRTALKGINYVNGYKMVNSKNNKYQYYDDLFPDMLSTFICMYSELLL